MRTRLSGRFWRSIFAAEAGQVLRGARSIEGRYHHGGQPALYISPTPEHSRIAIEAYLRPGDPPRVIVPLDLANASLVDVRDAAVQRALGLTGAEAGTPWQPERSAELPATSWIASDAARACGADGMIYAARSDATRWHIVLFRWNVPGGATVLQNDPPIPF